MCMNAIIINIATKQSSQNVSQKNLLNSWTTPKYCKLGGPTLNRVRSWLETLTQATPYFDLHEQTKRHISFYMYQVSTHISKHISKVSRIPWYYIHICIAKMINSAYTTHNSIPPKPTPLHCIPSYSGYPIPVHVPCTIASRILGKIALKSIHWKLVDSWC